MTDSKNKDAECSNAHYLFRMTGSRDAYEQISCESGVAPHCPYLTLKKCPQYFESRAQREALTDQQIAELEEFWNDSDLYPLDGTCAPESSGGPNLTPNCACFCPEVLGEQFGVYANNLSPHTNDTDREIAEKSLDKVSTLPNDLRHLWRVATPLHYTECPSYALL
jgi:hypothetical protein